jgi:hypothetical protein
MKEATSEILTDEHVTSEIRELTYAEMTAVAGGFQPSYPTGGFHPFYPAAVLFRPLPSYAVA